MELWKNLQRYRAKRLVRQAADYHGAFHMIPSHSPADAIAMCRKAIRLDPENSEAYLVLGDALNKEGSREDAIAQYRRAIEIEPGLSRGHANLAEVLLIEGETAGTAKKKEEAQRLLEEAVSEFRNAFSIRMGTWQKRSQLGKALCALGRYDEAIAEYRDAMKSEPDNSWLCYKLGAAQLESGLYDDALATYSHLVEKNPENKGNHIGVGRALAALGRIDEALTEYRKGEFHVKAGELLMESGRHDEAVNEFRISIDKDQAIKYMAYYNIGMFLSEKAQRQEALEYLRTFLKLVDEMKDSIGSSNEINEARDKAIRVIKEIEK
jgi:protein O-GlcNAc transferase